MLPLSKKLILNQKICLGVHDYNPFHKMSRVHDFKDYFILLEDLIFDVLKYQKQNESSKNIHSLINLNKKILVIDDQSFIARDYWQRTPGDICSKENLPEDLSEYWLIVELLFVKNKKSILADLALNDEQLVISLISRNNEDEVKNVFFNASFNVSYSTKNKKFRISGASRNLMGKEKFLMPFGPWPRPLKDWDLLVEKPIPEHIQNLFFKK